MPNVKYTDEFPVFSDAHGLTSNPGWVDLSNSYPAVVGSPAADEAEARLQGVSVAGLYEFMISSTWEVDNANNGISSRFSLDGGLSWEEFFSAPSGANELQNTMYAFPLTRNSASFDLVVQGRKTNAANTAILRFLSIWFKRIG